MRYEAARHRHIHHKEARAINVDFDVATALSGGLVSCIALAQVPNGHSVAIESLDVLMYATLSLYEHHCPAPLPQLHRGVRKTRSDNWLALHFNIG